MAVLAGAAQRALVAGGFVLLSSYVVLICVQRKGERHRRWRKRVTYKKLSKSCGSPLLFCRNMSDMRHPDSLLRLPVQIRPGPLLRTGYR